MECDDRVLLDEWMAAWRDIVGLVHPRSRLAEASARVPP
jgi:hypothetical protein